MVVPTLCIVGKSGSGKTTLLEALIPELKALGHRVAVVKHSPHGSDLDVEAKDSWRLLKSGGDVVLLSGPGQVAQFRRVTGDSTLEELASHVWDTDIFLAEGYKDSSFPKIEVVRRELGLDLLCQETQLVAVVSDSDIAVSVPRFRPEDAASLARFIEETYILPDRREIQARVTVNGEEVPLKHFAARFIARGALGMATALKGIERVRRLAIFVRTHPGDE